MDGPSHYREAEKLIAKITDVKVAAPVAQSYAAVAQVHATLALAAATALTADDMPAWDYEAWTDVAATPYKAPPS